MTLTDRQQEVLSFIQQYIATQGYAPSRKDILNAIGFKSLASVTNAIKQLTKKGRITFVPNVARSIRVV